MHRLRMIIATNRLVSSPPISSSNDRLEDIVGFDAGRNARVLFAMVKVIFVGCWYAYHLRFRPPAESLPGCNNVALLDESSKSEALRLIVLSPRNSRL